MNNILNSLSPRFYENVAIVSSSTSTRKSSHYHNKKAQYSPSIRSDAVSYIYDQSSQKKHNILGKQDSNLSRQMLLKQDSHSSRQMLLKQESFSSISRQDSNASRQMLLKQESNGSRHLLSKQDSQISYIDQRKGYLMRQDSDLSKRDQLCKQDSTISYIEPRKGILNKQDTQISYIESKKNSLCSQDSDTIYHKRHQLVKQDSIVSFSDQRPSGMRLCNVHCITSTLGECNNEYFVSFPMFIFCLLQSFRHASSSVGQTRLCHLICRSTKGIHDEARFHATVFIDKSK